MTSESQDREATIEQCVGNVVRIGRLWAVYGLEVGRAALRTSAETLRTTSELLGSLAKQLDEQQAAAEATASTAPATTTDQHA
ncbi:hypothetical protein [Sandaracinus amylolyticus]|uniref:Uncharacterized protein n=1 Tax=Sandaracinus amylolyticus TaxID=927083 RepID=A0A0F6SF98_9BACT|nr:hypothetical protein [Sandaracinus amylolyticus]AKF06569.1 hypothetical protein DB32_003718 [Sandaracinus amylolyticus]